MIYNSKIESDNNNAKWYLDYLISNGKRYEIKEIRKSRSLKQNAYLHLILSYFALEVGETTEYIKQEVFKGIVNKDYFVYERINPKNKTKSRKALKSTRELNTKEMTDCIERFKNWAVMKYQIKLPDANEREFLDYIKNEIEKNKQWL